MPSSDSRNANRASQRALPSNFCSYHCARHPKSSSPRVLVIYLQVRGLRICTLLRAWYQVSCIVTPLAPLPSLLHVSSAPSNPVTHPTACARGEIHQIPPPGPTYSIRSASPATPWSPPAVCLSLCNSSHGTVACRPPPPLLVALYRRGQQARKAQPSASASASRKLQSLCSASGFPCQALLRQLRNVTCSRLELFSSCRRLHRTSQHRFLSAWAKHASHTHLPTSLSLPYPTICLAFVGCGDLRLPLPSILLHP